MVTRSIVLLVVSSRSTAHRRALCLKKNGVVVLRDACAQEETPITSRRAGRDRGTPASPPGPTGRPRAEG